MTTIDVVLIFLVCLLIAFIVAGLFSLKKAKNN